MANKNKFTVNSELPTPGKSSETLDTHEHEAASANPAGKNVENATARIESLEGRGAEIRTRATEKMKALGKWAVSKLDRGIGRTAAGAEKIKEKTVAGAERTKDAIDSARQYAVDLGSAATERMSQRQARKERKATQKEREFNNAWSDETDFLSRVQPGDADAFNSMPRGTAAERSGREKAKQDAIDAAHTEALGENARYDRAYEAQKQRHDTGDIAAWDSNTDSMNATQRKGVEAANREAFESAHEEALEENERRDTEEREKIELENQKYDARLEEVSDWLKKRFGARHGKNIDLAAVSNELRSAFPSGESYDQDAVFDAFNAFGGKKSKQAARAARIAKGKAKFAETRHKAYEKTRDRSSEAYQSALKQGKKIGKAIGRFSKRTASAAKAGFQGARTNWNASKQAAAAEAQPVTNE